MRVHAAGAGPFRLLGAFLNPVAANDAALDASLGSVQASAAQRLASAIGEAAPSASTESPSPEPAAAAPPASTTPATPPAVSPTAGQGSPPAGQPASPGIDPNSLTPEARRFLEMQGGDINRALSKGLEYNNRLGSRGQDGAAPQAGEPPATETAAAEPAPPVAVDPKVIDTEVARLLDQDRVCADALRAFASVQERISTIYDAKTGTGKLPALEKAIQMAQLRLELPEVKEDPTKSYEIEQELREHRSELRELRAEQRDLKLEAREHRERYNARSNEYTQRVRSVLEGRAAETQRQAAFETASNSYMSELETSWPTALKEAATAAKIPDDLLPALESRAMDRADADLNNRHPVKNINEFMTKVATEYAQELETHHRVKSQEYGRLATQRADQGGPPGSGVAPTVPQTPPTDLNDVYARAQNRLAAGMRGVAT